MIKIRIEGETFTVYNVSKIQQNLCEVFEQPINLVKVSTDVLEFEGYNK